MASTETTLKIHIDFSQLGLAQAFVDVAKERQRQVEAEGWTPEHDDQHNDEELARAAACYAMPLVRRSPDNGAGFVNVYWPWTLGWWKPTNRRRDLVMAGALILAEIERIDRLEQRQPEPAGSGDSDGGGDGQDDQVARAAVEGEPEPDTETMMSYSAHEAEFPAAVRQVTPNAEA